jgi:hypothetical protein
MKNNPNRRDAIQTISSSFGALAFAALATEQARAEAPNPLAEKKPHFKARAKRVIFLSMRGAPSHVDMFDYKPQLNKDDGKSGKYSGGRGGKLMGSPWEFNAYGESGLKISSLLPLIGSVADEICLLRGMHCDQPNHSQATLAAHTGTSQFVRPSLGAWSLYGLGTQNQDLPGFVALNAGGGANLYGSGFLPAIYQGSAIQGSGRGGGGGMFSRQAADPTVPNIKNPRLSDEAQRKQLDFMQKLNRTRLRRDVWQPQVEGIIQSYELAFRMQTTMPDLMDLSKESKAMQEYYGIGNDATDGFGRQCLLARRMVEAGVRFVEVTSNGWDHHFNLREQLETRCTSIDRPVAALLADLKQRGLLKDTLVIWAGEFGRTPHGQGGDGRDHNNKGYTTWMAGGGVKGGFSYGATDPHGYEAVEGRMHTHDWHATILHLLGLNHERLTYRYAGRDFRLTDVHGSVAKEILA